MADQTPTQYKRRLIPIVDKAFQFKYTGIILLVAVVTSTVLGYLLLRSYREMNEVIQLAGIIPEVGEKLNADDSRFVFKVTLGFLVAEVAILGVMGLLITHRVCGPVFVLSRHFQTLAAGRFPSLRPLRQGDEFAETFLAFGKAVDRLRAQDQKEAASLKTIVAAAREKGLAEADVAALETMLNEREARLEPR